MAGWISVHRKLQNHLLWKDRPFAKGQAWIDLLLLASYEEKTVLSKRESVELKRGSFLTSDQELTDRWGWNRKKTRSFLDLLTEEEMIELKRTPKGTVLTILNYDSYQNNGTTFGTSSGLGTSGLEHDEGTTFGTTIGTLLINTNKINKGEVSSKILRRSQETPEQAEQRRQRNAEFLRIADEMRARGAEEK